MQNSIENDERLHNRVAAGKPPFRIKFGMRGGLPKQKKNGFEGFVSFVTKQLNN